MNKNQLIAEAREILMNPKQGNTVPSHHGVYTDLLFMDRKFKVQLIRQSASGPARVGQGKPVLAFDSGLTSTPISKKDLAALRSIAQQVGPVLQHWNGVGTSQVSFELDLVPEWQPGQEIHLPEEWRG